MLNCLISIMFFTFCLLGKYALWSIGTVFKLQKLRIHFFTKLQRKIIHGSERKKALSIYNHWRITRPRLRHSSLCGTTKYIIYFKVDSQFLLVFHSWGVSFVKAYDTRWYTSPFPKALWVFNIWPLLMPARKECVNSPFKGQISVCGSGSGIRCFFDPWIRDP
jgi:hypothetical protein